MSRKGQRESDHHISVQRKERARKRQEHRLAVIRQTQPLPPEIKTTPQKYGNRIRDRRCAKGMTQRELANVVGISDVQLSRIEGGRVKKINIDLIYLFAIALDCKVDYLLGRATRPEVIILKQESASSPGTSIRAGYEPVRFTEKSIAELTMAFEELQRRDIELAECLFDIASSRDEVLLGRVKGALQAILCKTTTL